MTKNVKRLLSMLLALTMVFGYAVPAAAAETEGEVEPVAEKVTVSLDAADIELSFDMSTLWADGDVEVDEENPAIITLTKELKDIKVLNAEGETVPLTEEEIGQILAAGNRTAAGPTVPPGGLYMTHLWYDDGIEKFECPDIT